MNVDRDLLPMREAAAVLGVTQDAIRARIRRGTIEARKESGRWMVAVPADVQDAARDTTATDVDAVARIAALEADAAALRSQVAGQRELIDELREALRHERGEAAKVSAAHERMTLALPAPQADPPPRRRRWPLPWRR